MTQQNSLLSLLQQVSDQGNAEKDVERLLMHLCKKCPDPSGALHAFLDAPRGTSDEALLLEMLSMKKRAIEMVPYNEIPEKHPLRRLEQ